MELEKSSGNLKQFKWLTQGLIVSGALNIVLLATFFYQWIHEKPAASLEWQPVSEQAAVKDTPTNRQALAQFETMAFQQLVEKLQSKTLLEDGYTERDLALACLVSRHDFDLARALSGQPFEKIQLVFKGDNAVQAPSITMFPGLNDAQYEQICRFAATERWPLTTKGLFCAIKKGGAQQDPTLADAFTMSQEFQIVELLFTRSEATVQKTEILDLVVSGEWNDFSNFIEQQRLSQDLSAARRQQLLLSYVHQKSKLAAQMLLHIDGAFAARRLEDADALACLELLDTKTTESELFAVELLTSPRSNAIWKAAAARLYGYAGEQLPEPFNYKGAVARFVPREMITKKLDLPAVAKEAPKAKATPKVAVKAEEKARVPAPTDTKYIVYSVQNGDSLWKVSKKFKVSVAAIKKCNGLQSDGLKAGQQLKIPRKEQDS